MRSIWNWCRKLVAGSRGSEERLSVALDELPAHSYQLASDGAIYHRDADHVWRFVHDDSEPTSGGFRYRLLEGPWPVGDTFTRPLPGDSDTLGDCTSPAARHGD